MGGKNHTPLGCVGVSGAGLPLDGKGERVNSESKWSQQLAMSFSSPSVIPVSQLCL